MCDCNNQNSTCQYVQKTGVIYLITNLLNGKKYVGQTRQNLNDRIRQHCNSKINSGIDAAIKKYGRENFKYEVIEEIPVEMLNTREIFWIAELNCKSPKGYNLTDGGEGILNCSQETRARISANHADFSGKNNPNYGKHRKHSQATRDKMSEDRSGEKHHMFGKHHSQETKDKIAAAHKNKKISQETRAKMSKSHFREKNHNYGKTHEKSHWFGKHHSEETKAKMSASRKAYLAKKKAEKNLENIDD